MRGYDGGPMTTLQVKLVLEQPFNMLSEAPSSIVDPVMDHLRFSKKLTSLADEIGAKLALATGSEEFNGLHLRVEADAVNFANNVGGARQNLKRCCCGQNQPQRLRAVPLHQLLLRPWDASCLGIRANSTTACMVQHD